MKQLQHNQALPSRKQRGRQADGCQLGAINMASIGFSLNNFFFSNLKLISAAAPVLWDPRFDHNLIGQHQICRIGISAGPLGGI